MAQSQAAEPSMEEILASIRRIIAEDDSTPRKGAEPPLELTRPAEAAAPPVQPPPKAMAMPSSEIDDLEVFDDEPVAYEPPPAAAPAPEPPRARAPIPPPQPEPLFDEDSIVSEPAFQAAAGAFTRLAGTMRVADAPGQTLEGVVREMLRPMLKEWLDANLPTIVEAKVEAELQRIARAGR